MRLLIPLSEIAPRRADEADIGDVGLLRRLDHLHRDVEFLFMRRRNQAHGLGADLLQGLDGVFQTAWFVCHDLDAQLGEFLAFFCVGVQSETCDGLDVGFEGLVCEEQLGDEEAGVAVYRGDANCAGHFSSWSILVNSRQFVSIQLFGIPEVGC
jgi:hypothetical protein